MRKTPKLVLVLGLVTFVLLGLFTGCPTEVDEPKESVKAITITTDPEDVSALDNDTGVEVTLATATEGAKIYYTLDGTAPTTSSTEYDEPFTVKANDINGKTVTVKAIGIKKDFDNSQVATKDIVFKADAVAVANAAIAAALANVGDVELAFGTEVNADNIIEALPEVDGIEYAAVLKEGATWTITVSDTEGKGTLQTKDIVVTIEKGPVFSVGEDKGYYTIQDAVADVKTGDTIVLRSDLSVGSTSIVIDSTKELTLDLNGKTLSSNIEKAFMINGAGKLTVTDKSQNASGEIATAEDYMFMVENGTLILESGTYTSTSTWGGGLYGGEFINIKGSTEETATDYSVVKILKDATLDYIGNPANAGGYGINIGETSESAYGIYVEVNGKIITKAGASLYINGKVKKTSGNVPKIVVGSTADLEGLIYAAGYADWTIQEGANIEGVMALTIKSGKFTINGGTFKATGEYKDPADANNNGTEDTGATISITSNDGYAGEIDVVINGGSFISENGHALYEGIAKKTDGNPAAVATKVINLKVDAGVFVGASGLADILITHEPYEIAQAIIDVSNVVLPTP